VPTYRDEAVILRTHKLGEADRIVTMLSRRNGKIRAVAKGVRRTSSKFGSRLEPFMVADVQLYQGRSLDIVQQAESLGSYGADIAVDYERFTAASAMVETADRLNESEATAEQYLLLVGGLRSLARGEHDSRSILDSYLLRVMALSGWAPALEDCARCGAPGPHTHFGPQLGGTVCTDCAPAGSPRIAESTLNLMRELMRGDWDRIDSAESGDLAAASGTVAAYAQWHLERGIRSLEHVTASDRHAPFARLGSTEGLGSSQRPTPSQRQGSR
jgi:DNA repair protein RecO (recombination protein O)